MKKLKFLLMALISLSVVFTSCKNDDPDGKWDVEAEVSNGAAYNATIDSVYAYVYVGSRDDAIVGRAKYENGGFKMNLSAVPSSGLESPFEDDDIPESLTVSDKSVKISSSCTFMGQKGEKHVGQFFLSKYTFDEIKKAILGEPNSELDESAIVMHIYADKDVKIKGTVTDTYTHYDEEGNELTVTEKMNFNVTLKQGWNMLTGKTVVDTKTNFEVDIFTITKLDGYHWVFISEDMFHNMPAPRAKILRR